MIEVVGNDRIVGAHVSHNKKNNKKKNLQRERVREKWG